MNTHIVIGEALAAIIFLTVLTVMAIIAVKVILAIVQIGYERPPFDRSEYETWHTNPKYAKEQAAWLAKQRQR